MNINFKHQKEITDPQSYQIKSQGEFVESLKNIQHNHGMVDISFNNIKSLGDVEEAIQILQGIKEIVGQPEKKMEVTHLITNGRFEASHTFSNHDQLQLTFKTNSGPVVVDCKMVDHSHAPIDHYKIFSHYFTFEVPGKYYYTFLNMVNEDARNYGDSNNIILIHNENHFILENVVLIELEDTREISEKENNFQVKFIVPSIIYV